MDAIAYVVNGSWHAFKLSVNYLQVHLLECLVFLVHFSLVLVVSVNIYSCWWYFKGYCLAYMPTKKRVYYTSKNVTLLGILDDLLNSMYGTVIEDTQFH